MDTPECSRWVPVPDAPPSAAWARLYAGLVQLAEHEAAGRLDDEDTPKGFTASRWALLDVIGYLQECDPLMHAKAVTPLVRLAMALEDLTRGSRPEMLAPRKKNGGPPMESPRAHVIGFAARAMDRLMQAGDDAKHAAAKVCSAMKKGHAAGWQKVDRNTVIRWRARCMEGPGADVSPAAIAKFREQIYRITPPPAEEARMLLVILSEAHRRGLGE